MSPDLDILVWKKGGIVLNAVGQNQGWCYSSQSNHSQLIHPYAFS